MRVLYVGQLWEGGTCLSRARALNKLGYDIIKVDVTPYLVQYPRPVRAIQARLLAGPAVTKLNRDLVQRVRDSGHPNILWIDKGTWIWPETLEAARRAGVTLLVHYTPDPAFHVHTSRHFNACVALYDLCITTKRYELDLYRQSGAREVVFTWQGVDGRFERIAACAAIEAPERSGLLFIGHHEPHYERTLAAIARAGLPLRVSGPRWPARTRGNRLFEAVEIGDAVTGDAYAEKLASAAIGVGLLGKTCPDQFTTRTFEIPAAGAMLLAEDTAEHRALFRADVEAVFFNDVAELVDKAKFYIENEEARRAIARRGRALVMDQFRWENVLQPVIRWLEARPEVSTHPTVAA